MKDKQNSQTEQIAPEPYQRPQFFIYGNIRDITQTVGTHGAKDSGPKGANKTSI